MLNLLGLLLVCTYTRTGANVSNTMRTLYGQWKQREGVSRVTRNWSRLVCKTTRRNSRSLNRSAHGTRKASRARDLWVISKHPLRSSRTWKICGIRFGFLITFLVSWSLQIAREKLDYVIWWRDGRDAACSHSYSS
jgi:hypothetical protein